MSAMRLLPAQFSFLSIFFFGLQGILGQDMSQDEVRITAFLLRYRCQHVYLDVGSNVGIQIRKLFQPDLYANAKVRPQFDAVFGSSPRCGVCAIGFEPNPRHTDMLDVLERRLGAAGFGAMVLRAAVGASEGSLRLQFGVRRSMYNDAGASVLGIGRYQGHASVVVRQVHLARIMQHVRRQLPRSANILMKLDVEGSEWVILPDLMGTRAICAADRIFIEYHTSDFQRLEQERRNDLLQAASYRAMRMSLQSTRAALERAIKEHARRNFSGGCSVQLVEMDDETHVLDMGSKPWPHRVLCS